MLPFFECSKVIPSKSVYENIIRPLYKKSQQHEGNMFKIGQIAQIFTLNLYTLAKELALYSIYNVKNRLNTAKKQKVPTFF